MISLNQRVNLEELTLTPPIWNAIKFMAYEYLNILSLIDDVKHFTI